jgi:hypothetical protein
MCVIYVIIGLVTAILLTLSFLVTAAAGIRRESSCASDRSSIEYQK